MRLWPFRWYAEPAQGRPRCPKHGPVLETFKVKNTDKLDGEYCSKCLAESWAKVCKRVTYD